MLVKNWPNPKVRPIHGMKKLCMGLIFRASEILGHNTEWHMLELPDTPNDTISSWSACSRLEDSWQIGKEVPDAVPQNTLESCTQRLTYFQEDKIKFFFLFWSSYFVNWLEEAPTEMHQTCRWDRTREAIKKKKKHWDHDLDIWFSTPPTYM